MLDFRRTIRTHFGLSVPVQVVRFVVMQVQPLAELYGLNWIVLTGIKRVGRFN